MVLEIIYSKEYNMVSTILDPTRTLPIYIFMDGGNGIDLYLILLVESGTGGPGSLYDLFKS